MIKGRTETSIYKSTDVSLLNLPPMMINHSNVAGYDFGVNQRILFSRVYYNPSYFHDDEA